MTKLALAFVFSVIKPRLHLLSLPFLIFLHEGSSSVVDKLMTGRPQWLLQCDRGAGAGAEANDCSVLVEEKYIR